MQSGIVEGGAVASPWLFYVFAQQRAAAWLICIIAKIPVAAWLICIMASTRGPAGRIPPAGRSLPTPELARLVGLSLTRCLKDERISEVEEAQRTVARWSLPHILFKLLLNVCKDVASNVSVTYIRSTSREFVSNYPCPKRIATS